MSDSKRKDLSHLLDETQWVRGLARHLVRDEGAVDDLVQETHLAALQRRPAGNLRAWLAAVVRNLVRKKRRTDSIRNRHERSAATSEVLEEDGGLQRVRLQRALADTVLELDEPHRRVVVERYFDELSYREIAARHKTSEVAVRKRVSRALVQLRRSLRRRGFERLLLCVVPLRSWSTPTVGTGLVVLGGYVMGWKTACSVVAAAALTIGVVHWSRTPAPPAVDSLSETGVEASLFEGSPHAGVPAEIARDRREVTVDDVRGSGVMSPHATTSLPLSDLRGTVSDSSGQLVAGARIEVRRDPLREYGTRDPDVDYDRPGALLAQATSNESGEFTVALPMGQPVDLWVRAEGFSAAGVPDRYAGEFVEVQLQRGAAFHGRVTQAADGLPVSGAVLSGWRDDATRLPVFKGKTDVRGAFHFPDLEPGAIRVLVNPQRLSPPDAPIALELLEGGDHRMDFQLEPGLTVRGVVVDAGTGQPIADATVGQGWRLFKSATTDASGEFELHGFARDGSPEIHARAAGYGRAIRSLSFAADNTARLEIRLSKGFEAFGRVVNGAGQPLADAYVAGVASLEDVQDTQGADWRSTMTDGDGSFVLEDLRSDAAHVLLVIRGGHGPAMAPFPEWMGHEEMDLGVVQLSTGGTVSGLVIDETGMGLRDYRLRLVGVDDNPLVGMVRDERNRWTDDGVYLNQRIGRTDDAGRFRFVDLVEGEYEIEVSRYRADVLTVTEEFDGALRQRVRVDAGESVDDLRIVLLAEQTIAGTVLTPSGEPVASILVWLESHGEQDPDSNVVTGADGKFEFRHLVPGLYRLDAFPTNIDGYEPPYQANGIESVLAGETQLRIVLEPAAVTSGFVRNADGSPAIKASVMALDEEGEEIERAFTETDGSFTLNLKPGLRVDLLARPAPTDGPFWNPALFPPRSEGTEQEGVVSGTTGLQLRLPN